MRPAIFLALFSAVCALPRQQNNVYQRDLVSDLASAFGFDDEDPTSTAPASTRLIGDPVQTSDDGPQHSKTLVPPATTAASVNIVTKSGHSPPSSTSTDDSSSTDSNSATSSTDSSTITSISSTPSKSTITSTASSSSSSSTSTAAPTSIPTDQSSQQSSSSNGGGGVSGGGIAVAIIMTLAVLAIIGWFVFRYHPKVRAWWLRREEKRMQARSYRDAIDGPFARGGTGVRNQALTGGGGSRKSMLASFFAPRTVRLGNGKEIRRKPVNWGASSHDDDDSQGYGNAGVGMEKVALTNMAAPMARNESTKSTSASSVVSALTVNSVRHKELPPMPPLPPIPPEPQRPRDVHKILSRKSIFELA